MDFARRKQNAVQAYYEWIPIRPANGDTFPEILNINRTFAIGASAAVHSVACASGPTARQDLSMAELTSMTLPRCT